MAGMALDSQCKHQHAQKRQTTQELPKSDANFFRSQNGKMWTNAQYNCVI